MTTGDYATRRQSTSNFQAAVELMASEIANALQADVTIPALRISSAQIARGQWPFPEQYRSILEIAVTNLMIRRNYRPTNAQFHLACLLGATIAGKLYIDGVREEISSKPRITTAHTRRGPIRKRGSLRGKTR